MKFLCLNSSNYVSGSNNVFAYNFPTSIRFTEGDQVAVSSVDMFNSIFNIQATRNNNSFQLIINYATPVTLNVLFPDGYYAVSDIQSYIQSICYTSGYYLLSTTGNIVYPVEIAPNLINYSIQWVCNTIPTSAQASGVFTKPTGATWNFPSTASCSQVVFYNNNFGALVGILNPATYPNAIQATPYTFASNTVAILNPVSTLILTSNFICNSSYSNPSNILYSIPITSSFASVISQSANNLIFNDIQPGTYQSLIITFLDQLYNPVILHDFTVNITLVIRQAGEK